MNSLDREADPAQPSLPWGENCTSLAEMSSSKSGLGGRPGVAPHGPAYTEKAKLCPRELKDDPVLKPPGWERLGWGGQRGCSGSHIVGSVDGWINGLSLAGVGGKGAGREESGEATTLSLEGFALSVAPPAAVLGLISRPQRLFLQLIRL